MVNYWSTIPFIWLNLCGQVNVPPNRNSGCNHLFIGELQPEIRVYVSGLLVLYCGLRSGYAGDGHAVGGAADVVHAEFCTELNG